MLGEGAIKTGHKMNDLLALQGQFKPDILLQLDF